MAGGVTPEDFEFFSKHWTVETVMLLACAMHEIKAGRGCVWRMLVSSGLSWKKTCRLLAKASRSKRAEFMPRLIGLLNSAAAGERVLLFVDEAHFRQDFEGGGYDWTFKGQKFQIPSSSPGLKKKSYYGAYNPVESHAFLMPYIKSNAVSTNEFLEQIAKKYPGKRVVIVWDNGPAHRAKAVRAKAMELGIELEFLPPYSPDLNPIEGLWKWIRTEVTRTVCHDSVDDLDQDVTAFIGKINANPKMVLTRLKPKLSLHPEHEARLSP